MWAFKESDKEALLHEEFLAELELASQTRGTDFQVKNATRKVCKRWLAETENFRSDRCPINLSLLTFECFSKYLTTRKKKNMKYLSNHHMMVL